MTNLEKQILKETFLEELFGKDIDLDKIPFELKNDTKTIDIIIGNDEKAKLDLIADKKAEEATKIDSQIEYMNSQIVKLQNKVNELQTEKESLL